MNLKSLLQNQRNELPDPHPSMIPSLEPSVDFQQSRKRAMPLHTELTKPPAIRQLDAILSTIIGSLNPDEHREFFSSLAIYNTISGKSTDALSAIQSSTPPLSLASSPESQSDTQRALFKLPKLESISKSFSNCPPMGPSNRGILSSKETPKMGPPLRLPNVLDLAPLSRELPNQHQSQPPLVSGIAGIDKNTDMMAFRKRKRAPRVKHYGDAQPSMHCHICESLLTQSLLLHCRDRFLHVSSQFVSLFISLSLPERLPIGEKCQSQSMRSSSKRNLSESHVCFVISSFSCFGAS